MAGLAIGDGTVLCLDGVEKIGKGDEKKCYRFGHVDIKSCILRNISWCMRLEK